MYMAFVLALGLAQHPAMPAGMTHEQHLARMNADAEMKQRGAAAMGFDQEATTHHFVLTAEGGLIEVTVKNATDRTNLDAIRAHLDAIAKEFSAGRFDAPLATHGEVPPGVPVMQRLKSAIAYRYEPLAVGGRVRIVSASDEAIAAVHAFLRYQIREHRTGDPG